jgi:PAS domain S-box-containing protein
MNSHPPTERRTGWRLALIFVLLAVGIVAVGWLYYRSIDRHNRVEVEHQFSAIADLKVGELAQWRKERLGDAAILHNHPAFTQLTRRFLASPADADAQRQLQAWLGKYQAQGPYDRVFVLDAQGAVRMSVPESPVPVAAVMLARAAEVLRSGQPAFQDFFQHELSQRIYLALLVPVRDETDGHRPLGVLVLRMDPAAYLYPFINRWPVPSATAETLLVRREGNDALFLNELRFQTNTALTLRVSLTNTSMPAVQAALGREGIFDGLDYRGVPVVAALRAIPDSPWALVARVDVSEVSAPLRAQLWQVVVMIGILLFAAGAGVGLAWRQQQLRFYPERAQAADLMRASELRYRRLFEAARDGILILDAETGMVVDVNPFLIELLGYSREAFLGKKVWELGFLKDLIANQANFAELQQKEYIRYEDMALETSDGRRIEVEFVSYLYRVNDLKMIQCNIREISERKRAEAAAKRASQELQEKNAELERFLYTASHELKTPVVTVRTFLGYLDLDMASADAGKIEKDLRFIRGATDKMAQLLDELLEISRIGRVVNPPVCVTLRSLADETLGAVAGRITERGVAVKVGDNDLTLHGDRPRLAEIWQNLVENACKFMGDQKEPRIEIGAEPRGAETVFFVCDNGSGIDPRYHTKVFGLFDKLDPKAEGTGIGLALVKRIVELYQGRIWVESAGLGQGACFYFTLPGAVGEQKTGDRIQKTGDRRREAE